MKKIKISHILIGILVLVGCLGIRTSAVLAADTAPGCYLSTAGKTAKTTCPDESRQRSTAPPLNKCYLATYRESPPPAYNEVPCSSITVAGSNAATSSSAPAETLDVVRTGDQTGKYICGKGDGNEVNVSFDFGCIGGNAEKYSGAKLNPIVDIAFAIFRFVSVGVGLIVIGSMIIAGIQYTASRGDPQATGAAIKRVSNSLIGLLLYIFMFAIANFLVPGGMFI